MFSHTATSANKTNELPLYRTTTKASQLSWSSGIPSTIQLEEPSPLTSLPWELQLLIISHLDVRGALQLRRTCRLYFWYLTIEVIEQIFTENRYITFDLLNCCIDCFAIPSDGYLVQDDFYRRGIWKSMCFHCWRVKRSSHYYEKPNRRISYTNGRNGCACILCGWPIRHDTKHPSCKRALAIMNTMWWSFSIAHFLFALVVSTMVWLKYASVTVVIIPTVFNFLIAFVSLALLTMDLFRRSNTSRLRLPLELASTLIWTPPVFYTAREVFEGTATGASYPVFIWGLFLAKLVGHALNFVGFVLLSSGYDPRSPFLPDLSTKRRILYILSSFLAYWARSKYR
ncbi:hypothetical protein F4781DRAFT_163493 [Annulohypoxylon bovei var. microspora]|nr:hypothetical protein F4781DRAFT_163493 [Annulohypoxylon bovei var. microspora]